MTKIELKIDTNIPMPKKTNRFQRIYFDVWQKMNVGDSILLTRGYETQLYEALRIFEGSSNGKILRKPESNKMIRVWKKQEGEKINANRNIQTK